MGRAMESMDLLHFCLFNSNVTERSRDGSKENFLLNELGEKRRVVSAWNFHLACEVFWFQELS
jgi:hypothetical protein